MKTTRRILAARCTKLQDQLTATNHESRKVRAARLVALTKENEGLKATLANSTEQIAALKKETAGLKATLAALASNAAAAK